MTINERAALAVALAAGEISHGQFCAMTGLDVAQAREVVNGAIRLANEVWERWRRENPPRDKRGD